MNTNIPDALRPGTELQGGKYIIREALGQGATGITYLASMRQVVQGELGSFDSFVNVAIKEFYMKSECQRGETTTNVVVPNSNRLQQVNQYKESFIKEAKKISGLSHSNIVHVLGVFNENDTVYYVMQFIAGGSVKEFIDHNGPVREDYALKYTRQIASALDYMHIQKNMCHYDLKPGNIMLTTDNDAMLIDFGIAKNYDEQGNETSTTPPGLTKGFAPIEQYSSISGFSPKSDVYSLGATLYAMLTGVTPPEPFEWLSGKAFTEKPDNVSPRAWSIVQSAMKISSADRPTMRDLIGLIDGKPQPAVTPGPEDERTLTFEELQKRQQQTPDQPEETILPEKNPATPVTPAPQPGPDQPVQPDQPVKIQKKSNSSTLIICLCVLIGIIVAGGVTYALLTMSDKQPTETVADEETQSGEEKAIYSSDGHLIMRYTGEIANGQPVGSGKLTYLEDPDRESYEGAFLNGLREDSAAVLTYKNGDVYRGQFIADHFGTGTYFIKETGEYYRGTFRNDQPWNGYWYDKDDNVLSRVENGESK